MCWEVTSGFPCSVHLSSPGLVPHLWGPAVKVKKRPKSEQKGLRGSTCGRTHPGPLAGLRLVRCSVLSSSSCPTWPPRTDHSGRSLLSPPSGLGSPAFADMKPLPSAQKTSPFKVPKPAINKRLTLLTPFVAFKSSHKGQDRCLLFGV